MEELFPLSEFTFASTTTERKLGTIMPYFSPVDYYFEHNTSYVHHLLLL
jgi:hypothetical protein